MSGRTDGDFKYRIRSCSSSGCSQYRESIVVDVTAPVNNPPSAPTSMSAPSSDNNGAFSVSWNASSGATSYVLEKYQQPVDSGFQVVTTTTSLSYSFSGLSEGIYQFRVKACNAYGCSGYSNVAQTSVVIFTPPPPGTFEF